MKNIESILYLLLFLPLISCNANSKTIASDTTKKQNTYVNTFKGDKVVKTDEEWKNILSESEYYVLREKGTERSFTGDLLDNNSEGVYVCRGCGLPLFGSESKFKSGTGWPSFFEIIKEGNVATDTDYHIGYARTEILCGRCDGHLGHVFDDGPAPTGLRYCVNSASLDFEAKRKP